MSNILRLSWTSVFLYIFMWHVLCLSLHIVQVTWLSLMFCYQNVIYSLHFMQYSTSGMVFPTLCSQYMTYTLPIINYRTGNVAVSHLALLKCDLSFTVAMYVCMYMCMYVHMYVCTYICIYTYIATYIHNM